MGIFTYVIIAVVAVVAFMLIHWVFRKFIWPILEPLWLMAKLIFYIAVIVLLIGGFIAGTIFLWNTAEGALGTFAIAEIVFIVIYMILTLKVLKFVGGDTDSQDSSDVSNGTIDPLKRHEKDSSDTRVWRSCESCKYYNAGTANCRFDNSTVNLVDAKNRVCDHFEA